MHLKSSLLRASVATALMSIAGTVFAAGSDFVIQDIRIEGIARTEPGTVLSHLPFQVGDEFTDAKGNTAIHSLYGSGLFRDVRLERDGNVLVVQVQERPAVASISTQGIHAFDNAAIEQSLRDVGMAEGRIFDHATLDRADQEMRRQYLARGYYGVDVKTTVTPLDRNRVRISIVVDEGEAASIESIRFVGNRIMDDETLQEQMQLTKSGWMSWYTKSNLYSREKLAADIEAIRSYYMNNGYIDFKVDSVQVSIAPNKKDIFITINMTEGEQYHITGVELTGDLLGLQSELEQLIEIEPGTIYNAEVINNASTAITDKLSSLGYAFASARPNPVVTGENEAKVVYTIDPGRRAYVRHVNISGNSKTQDEVIRREVRQYEASWFDSEKVKLSRDRIDRLGFFDSVTVDPKPVPGTRDQVDLEVVVKERPTGSINLGAGFSTSDGVILSAGFAQNNIFGTGKAVSAEVNTSDSTRTYALSLTEPYVTPEGISRSIDIYDRRVDMDELDLADDLEYETRGASVSWGIPFTEFDRVYLGAKIENTLVDAGDRAPRRYKQYVDDFGDSPKSVAATIGWSRDSRDNALAPTRGTYQRLSGEVTLPVMDLRYYRASYQLQHYWPMTRDLTLAFNGEIGYGDSWGGKEYPFFKNFYAGGIGSVRGYENSSLGPKDNSSGGEGDSAGGNASLNFSFEMLMPLPGADRTLRWFTFFDGGWVWGDSYGQNGRVDDKMSISLSDLRYSVGVGVAWISPLGPLKFSIAAPINDKDGDDIERFQFQIGTGF
ncbi:outer membrane protein assembly factor BamA [Parasutterella secunda]|uniref:Outer membrane protein assembly factor BamA n=1 Tax=Parasutterella secunda TaxID=626947 RepID=A0ABS2GS78_9BURK|nr:outer membrane protein assembly factor BamA [Parasutterella secunda]MBM6928643.1 outer membrane protein assembly factor BamA [Parasutterella secunda]